MRQRSSSRGGDRRSTTTSRPAAQDPAPLPSGAAMTPGQALVLQRMVGNAAVVRLEQEDHGDGGVPGGDGGRADGPPAGDRRDAQRSTVHKVLGSQGRPLEGSLRAEMEARFGGADFSAVRVHTGADARRSTEELGASALTSRNHIVLGAAGAGKQTLAHELEHVRQQQAGPVPGTETDDGLRLSHPSDGAEVAAEATARRVMSGPAPSAPSAAAAATGGAAALAPVPDGQEPVQRKVVAQITAAPAGAQTTVRGVILGGRPDKVFPGTEGQHTTAYTVFAQAVRRVIKGRDAQAARQGIRDLFEHDATLPGHALIDGIEKASHRGMIETARTRIESLLLVPADAWDMLQLQDLVTEYLQFRGLMPLSTVNVKASGSGKFGTGDDEAGHKQVLVDHGKDANSGTREDLQVAIEGLMDVRAVAALAVERGAGAGEGMAPGINPDTSVDDVVLMYVGQHLASIELAFPGVVDAAWGSRDAAAKALVASVEAEKVAELDALRTKLHGEYSARDQRGDLVELEKTKATLKRYNFDPPAGASARNLRAKARAHGQALISMPGSPGAKMKQKLHIGGAKTDDKAPSSKSKSTGSSFKIPALDLKAAASGSKAAASGSKAAASGLPAGAEADDTGETSGFATQFRLDAAGNLQTPALQGRPLSRFGKAQGSHVTAWIVHVDAVSKQLAGKDVAAALAAAQELVDDVREMQALLEPEESGAAGPSGDAGEDLAAGLGALQIGDDVTSEDDDPDPQEEGEGALTLLTDKRIAAAERALRAAATRARQAMAEDTPPDVQVLVLQELTRAVLSRINLIQGVAFLGVSAIGANEGGYRATLRSAEAAGPSPTGSECRAAIVGMVDLKDMSDDARMVVLLTNHLRLIRKAYPTAFALAGFTDPDADAAGLLDDIKRRGKQKVTKKKPGKKPAKPRDDDDYIP